VIGRALDHAVAVPALLALVAGVAVLLGAGLEGSGAPPVGGVATAAVASISLPRGGRYTAIAAVGGRVVLSGRGSLYTSASDAIGAGRCDSVVVDPATLTLSANRSGDCEDPRLYGVRALAVNAFINGKPDGGHVRIAHATPRGFALGPIVMTYTELSDTDAEWVYGDGFLWVYDSLTTHGSELLRVSATTGTVLQTVRMPPIDRPLIAANADGFWLVPAGNSSGHGLYNVAPAMTRPALVSTAVGYGAIWMVASAHSVWLEVNHGSSNATLLRFDGRALALQATSRASLSEEEFGYGQPKFVGGAAGIWTVHNQELIRIDPGSARASRVTRIAGAYGQPTPVMVNGSLFVLEAPHTLYRVTPR
jgi:hypothetical protein